MEDWSSSFFTFAEPLCSYHPSSRNGIGFQKLGDRVYFDSNPVAHRKVISLQPLILGIR